MKILIALFVTLLFAFSAFAQTQAEVIVPTTFLRKAPNSSGEKIQTLQQGDKVTFEKAKETEGWTYVSISNGKIKGWISVNTIRSLVNEEKATQTLPDAAPTPTPTPSPTPTPLPTPISTPTLIAQATPTITPMPIVSPSPVPTVTPTPVPTPVEDKEVLQIETEEVSLNVRVVDGNNRAVSNLEQAQFEVYEDNVLQPITSFVTTEVPTINALVIDNSRSLRSQLGKVIEAGKILVKANQAKDESAIIRFVSANKIEVVQDFTLNKISLNNALDNLFVEGGQTAIIDAVYQATKKVEQYQNSQKIEDVRVRALVLVSDGDDRVSSKTEQDLVELLRVSQVQIYAVGFVNNLSNEPDPSGINRQAKAKAFLTRLSEETGGKVYFPTSIDELSNIATEISGELRTQYVISYSPTNDSRDGTFRQIKVVVADGANKLKRNAITRTGRTSALKEKR